MAAHRPPEPAARPLGQSILDRLYPPAPPAWKTSPVAFGELVNQRTHGPPAWERARHIEAMEEAFLDAIDPVKNPDGGRLIITVSVRHGKALDVDTPIPTPRGWTPIGKLVEGDTVYDERGQECRVTHAFDPYWSDDVYEVEFSDGTTLVADASHQWTGYSYYQAQALGRRRRQAGLPNQEWPEDWGVAASVRTTEEMAEDGGPFYIPVAEAIEGEEVVLPLDPYLFGVWLGDGAARQNTVTCHADDRPFLEAQARAAGFTTGDHVNGFKVAPTGSGYVSPFAATLRAMGVWGAKHVPLPYMRASRPQRLALLQGLMDSDGGPEGRHGGVSFTNQNARLADAVAELFTSLGAKVHRNERPAKISGRATGATAYRVTSSPPFNPFRLPRKAEKWKPGSLTRRTRTIRSITPITGGRVRCISVDSPSHLYLAGESMVPTHNSMFGSRIFPAWYLGNNPDSRVMLIGHEADFASRHGRAARDILTSHGHRFGVSVSKRSEAANRWDLEGREGGMLTLGIGGSPIGRGGNLCVVDDPYRNYKDAMSARVRQEVIEFVSGTMFSRVEPGGTIIIIMARWHKEDLVGHLLAAQPGVWTELRMPAICIDPDNDPTGRSLGEPLWPERWPLPALEQRHKETAITDGEVVWQAQYQQDPLAADGDMFDDTKWGSLDTIPWGDVKRWCRGWDLAATKNGGDWTVGVLMGELPDGGWVIADVVRGQWDSNEVRRKVRECAERDPRNTIIRLPQDPGQAGKDQKKQYATMLQGHRLRILPVNGSKEIRAGGVSSQQLVGNLYLPDGAQYEHWKGPLINETNSFPNGTHDDIVDALADAFNTLAGNRARLLV